MSVNTESISLNKFISRSGLCSRRAADRLIEEGRIKVNGQIALKGKRVSFQDEVQLDDQPVSITEDFDYILFNKPPGITCTTDPKDPSNILKLIDYPSRIFPVGLVEKFSEGLVILTSNGEFVNQYIEFNKNLENEYVVTLSSSVRTDFLTKISRGLKTDHHEFEKCSVERLGKCIFKIKLHEIINRQVPIMCQFLGYKVVQLRKIRIDKITLRGLDIGKWRKLTHEEIKDLKTKLS